jgi:hypothetical protein
VSTVSAGLEGRMLRVYAREEVRSGKGKGVSGRDDDDDGCGEGVRDWGRRRRPVVERWVVRLGGRVGMMSSSSSSSDEEGGAVGVERGRVGRSGCVEGQLGDMSSSKPRSIIVVLPRGTGREIICLSSSLDRRSKEDPGWRDAERLEREWVSERKS